MTSDQANDTYVTQASWAHPAGRPDAIDEIADMHERAAPAPSGAEHFWAPGEARWPQPPGPWDAGRGRAQLGIAS